MSTKEKQSKVRKCYECGGQMHGDRTYYHYKECGLDSVVLENVIVYRCNGCGSIVPEIPAMGELHRVITLAVIQKPKLLSGSEIKFLRKMANLSSKDLAQALGANASTLSRWENGSREISKKSDAALRLICFAGMLQEMWQEKDLLPTVSRAAKELSEANIMHILSRITDEVGAPVSLTIDPREFMQRGTPEAPVPVKHSPVQ